MYKRSLPRKKSRYIWKKRDCDETKCRGKLLLKFQSEKITGSEMNSWNQNWKSRNPKDVSIDSPSHVHHLNWKSLLCSTASSSFFLSWYCCWIIVVMSAEHNAGWWIEAELLCSSPGLVWVSSLGLKFGLRHWWLLLWHQLYSDPEDREEDPNSFMTKHCLVPFFPITPNHSV